jgi:hypothetical protein
MCLSGVTHPSRTVLLFSRIIIQRYKNSRIRSPSTVVGVNRRLCISLEPQMVWPRRSCELFAGFRHRLSTFWRRTAPAGPGNIFKRGRARSPALSLQNPVAMMRSSGNILSDHAHSFQMCILALICFRS